MVEIRLYSPFRGIVGHRSVTIEPDGEATVNSVLRALCSTYPELEAELFDDEYELQGSINVIRNGDNIRLLEGVRTPVESGDRISITASLEGG